MVTAREVPQLFGIVADNAATGSGPAEGVRLAAPGVEAIEIAVPMSGPAGAPRQVSMFGKPPFWARAAGDRATAWIRRVLDRDDVSLVWCADPGERPLGLDRFRVTDRAAFQDASPLTLLTTASVAQLGDWAGTPIAANRFRPNLMVDGAAAPFAEDGWRRVLIGDAVLRVVGRTARCVMTTIDPATLEKGREPIRSLAENRSSGGKTWCAVHLAIEQQGAIAVGDEVVVESR